MSEKPELMTNTNSLLIVIGVVLVSYFVGSAIRASGHGDNPALHAPISAAQTVPSPPGDYRVFEAQARDFLSSCEHFRASDKNDCLRHQQSFVRLYMQAMTGDFFSITAIASDLADDATSGVARSPVEACAWRSLLAMTTGNNPDYVASRDRSCGTLNADETAAANRRLAEIGRSLSPDAKAPTGYQPAIPGLSAAP